MAEYPNLDPPPPPDPVLEVLRECIAALRASCDWIAQPPRRLMLRGIADRAEEILTRTSGDVR